MRNFSSPRLRAWLQQSLVFTLSLIVLAASQIGFAAPVAGDQYQERIDTLNRDIRRNQSTINELRGNRQTLENRLNQLQAETARLEARLERTRLEIERTEHELAATEQELERYRRAMQENARTLYKLGSPNTVEILFSSSNFSEFLSQREYMDQVKGALNEASEAVIILKQELEEQQATLEALAMQQRSEHSALGEKQREQRQLIAETRGEEHRYQSMVESDRRRLADLEAQQRAAYAAAAASARRGGQFVAVGGSGNYPWAHVGYPCWSAGCADPWGLFYRECVSYTAWKVANTGRFVPHFGGAGNANQWPATTARHGIPNGTQPRAGSVAIDMRLQPYGHAMYVEAVHSNGTITVSEYNFVGPGQYSERTISASGLTYIYF